MHPKPTLYNFNTYAKQIDDLSLLIQGDSNTATFHLFPKLPSELRLAIWIYAAPKFQFVEMGYDQTTGRFWSCKPPPALLHVNRESRYTLIHDMKYVSAFKTRAFPACVLLSYKHNRIQLPFSSLRLSAVPEAELRYIRHLELKCAVETMSFDTERFLTQQLDRFQNLSTITILVDKPPPDWKFKYEQLEHIPWKRLLDAVAHDQLITWALRLRLLLCHHYLDIEIELKNPSQEVPRKIPRVKTAYLSRGGRRFQHIENMQ